MSLPGTTSDDGALREHLLALVPDGESPATPAAGLLLRERVYIQIRERIIDGRLVPGTRLRDVEIAETLGVSRTPVREAIRRLQDEGFVIAEASRWTKVADVNIADAEDLYPIVWTLERLAVKLGGPWNAEAIEGLRAVNDRLAKALDVGDARAASEADTDFHDQIVHRAGNRDLGAIIAQLRVRLRRLEIAYFDGTAAGHQSVIEHERVIAALESGDRDAGGHEIEHNWRASLSRLFARRSKE